MILCFNFFKLNMSLLLSSMLPQLQEVSKLLMFCKEICFFLILLCLLRSSLHNREMQSKDVQLIYISILQNLISVRKGQPVIVPKVYESCHRPARLSGPACDHLTTTAKATHWIGKLHNFSCLQLSSQYNKWERELMFPVSWSVVILRSSVRPGNLIPTVQQHGENSRAPSCDTFGLVLHIAAESVRPSQLYLLDSFSTAPI